jgi:hypothetical protein
MYSIILRLVLFLTLAIQARPSCASTYEPGIERVVLSYRGALTMPRVSEFIKSSALANASTLEITSAGGDVEAGMTLGRWIRENRIDVVVTGICLSSCANYVFLAGRRKAIQTYAVVAWHGSLEQRNFVERDQTYDLYSSRASKDPSEREFLDKNKRIVEASKRLRRVQADFFREISVDELITRIGQENTKPTLGLWTLDVNDMMTFGVCNIEAPWNYGSSAYLESALREGHRITALKLSEGQRGARGCPTPDGEAK